jgi:hypothetical protein
MFATAVLRDGCLVGRRRDVRRDGRHAISGEAVLVVSESVRLVHVSLGLVAHVGVLRQRDPHPPAGEIIQVAHVLARQQPTTPQGSVQFSMTLTVDDGTGRRYWLGQAYYTGAPDDQETAFNVMARTLVEQFGRTVRQRSFRIQ